MSNCDKISLCLSTHLCINLIFTTNWVLKWSRNDEWFFFGVAVVFKIIILYQQLVWHPFLGLYRKDPSLSYSIRDICKRRVKFNGKIYHRNRLKLLLSWEETAPWTFHLQGKFNTPMATIRPMWQLFLSLMSFYWQRTVPVLQHNKKL